MFKNDMFFYEMLFLAWFWSLLLFGSSKDTFHKYRRGIYVFVNREIKILLWCSARKVMRLI